MADVNKTTAPEEEKPNTDSSPVTPEEPKPEVKAEAPKSEPKSEVKTVTPEEPKPEVKTEAPKSEPKPEVKTEAKSEAPKKKKAAPDGETDGAAKKSKFKVDKKQIMRIAPRAFLSIIIVFLVVYLVSVIIFSDEFFKSSAERNALLHTEEDLAIANKNADEHYDNLYDIAHKIEYAPSKEAVDAVLKEYIGSEQFGDLRYYSGGVSYSPTGTVTEETIPEISELAASKAEGCTDVFFDKATEFDCIAFFVPIRGSEYVDGLLSIVPARNIISISEIVDDKTSSIAIIDKSGKVLASMCAEDFTETVGNNYFDFLSSISDNAEATTAARDVIATNEKATATVSLLGDRYTVTSAPLESFDDHLFFVSISVSEGLISDEATYIRHIVTLLIITIISLIVSLIYAYLFSRKAKEALSTANLTDETLECANAEQFRRTAVDTLHGDDRKYAVVAFSIKQFIYIRDSLGERETTELLKSIAKILGNFCDHHETFGYSGEGKFLCLYKYVNERALRDKIYLIGTLANKHEVLSTKNVKLKFNVGVCFAFDAKRRSVKEMIECAFAAASFTDNDSKLPYAVYSGEIAENITRDAKIETEMETALKNGDFKLFLQPKYNVSKDAIDSAEALVRWFDVKTGDYRFPGQFISLFEKNGFITKLDHFIYIEVLKYIQSAIAHGDNVVPIAVNVSRVTASDPDFIDYYVGYKHRYEIPDGLLTIEFTESFAMEDYDKIFNIVERLHRNGIRCSIDDFGSGYSSFNILKRVPMDELKLDRFFLLDGINRNRDDKIIEMVISLAKTMNMTVVQEGVENKEMFDRSTSMGIDVVQGYYYAKAISLEEYKIFLKSNTSIKYKSIVK